MLKKISIIVPCYNEEESLEIFYKEASCVLNTLDMQYSFLFVNDGSTDSTLDIIQKL